MIESDNENNVQSALESNLRLHPQRIELGQAEMLTDALLTKFDDLEQRLNTYISGSSGGDVLRKQMQAYLSRINSNVLIPLHFRLKVLNRFEEQLDLFDAEMTAAVLNAHKIGIDMVQKEALKEPSYYRILVDMVSQAIELAGTLMRDILGSYQAPPIITVRQVFDLMRLGLAVVKEIPGDAEKETKRLYMAIVRYELLRNLDFFSKTKPEQNMMMDELQHHIGILTPYLVKKGELRRPEVKGYSLLVTNLSRPNDTAQVIPFLPEASVTDVLVVPMDDFLDRLVTAIDRAEKVMKSAVLQSKELQVEHSLKTTVVGGNAILDALRTKSRDAVRQEYGNAKLVVGWSLTQSISDIQDDDDSKSAIFEQQAVDTPKRVPTLGNWTVMNVSREGLAIERLSNLEPERGVGSMVGLHWKPHRGEPLFGFIRWIRYPKLGEQQIGLEFYLRNYVPVRAVMLSIGDSKVKRAWSVLATFEKDGEHTIVFPDTTVFKGMVFSVSDDSYGGFFKVILVESVGPNYSICNVRIASELDTKSIDKQA